MFQEGYLRSAKRDFLGSALGDINQNTYTSASAASHKGRGFISTFNNGSNIASANANGALLLDALATPAANRTGAQQLLIREHQHVRSQQALNQPPHLDSTVLSSINASAIPDVSAMYRQPSSEARSQSMPVIAAANTVSSKAAATARISPDPLHPGRGAAISNIDFEAAAPFLAAQRPLQQASSKTVAFVDPVLGPAEPTLGARNRLNGYIETEIRAKIATSRAEVRELTDALVASYGMALFADLFSSDEMKRSKKSQVQNDRDQDFEVFEDGEEELPNTNAQPTTVRSTFEKHQLLRIEARRQQLLFEEQQHEAEIAARQAQIDNVNEHLYGRGRGAANRNPTIGFVRNPHHTAAEAQFLLKQYRMAMEDKDVADTVRQREAYAEEQLARLGKLSQVSAAALATARTRMATEEYQRQRKGGAERRHQQGSSGVESDGEDGEHTNRVDASGLVDDRHDTAEEDEVEAERETFETLEVTAHRSVSANNKIAKDEPHDDGAAATEDNDTPTAAVGGGDDRKLAVSAIRQIQAQVLLSYIMQAAAHHDPKAEGRLRSIGGAGNHNALRRSNDEDSDFYDNTDDNQFYFDDEEDERDRQLYRFAKGNVAHLYEKMKRPSSDDEEDRHKRHHSKDSKKHRRDKEGRDEVDDNAQFFKTITAMRGEADPSQYKKLLKEFYRQQALQHHRQPVRFAAADEDVYPYPTTSSSGHRTNATANSSDLPVSKTRRDRNANNGDSTLIGPQLISAIMHSSAAHSESPSPLTAHRRNNSPKTRVQGNSPKTRVRIESKNQQHASTADYDESTLDPNVRNAYSGKKSASFSSSSPLAPPPTASANKKPNQGSDAGYNSNSILKKQPPQPAQEDESDRRDGGQQKGSKGGKKGAMWSSGGRDASAQGSSSTTTVLDVTNKTSNNSGARKGMDYGHESTTSSSRRDIRNQSQSDRGIANTKGYRRFDDSAPSNKRSSRSSSSTSSRSSTRRSDSSPKHQQQRKQSNRNWNDSNSLATASIGDDSSYRRPSSPDDPSRSNRRRGGRREKSASNSSRSTKSDSDHDSVMNGTTAGLRAVGGRKIKTNAFFDASQANTTANTTATSSTDGKKKKGFWKRVFSGIFGKKKKDDAAKEGEATSADNEATKKKPTKPRNANSDSEGSANLNSSDSDNEDTQNRRPNKREQSSGSSRSSSRSSSGSPPRPKGGNNAAKKKQPESSDNENAARSFADTSATTDGGRRKRSNSSSSSETPPTRKDAKETAKKKPLASLLKFDCMGNKGGTID